MFFNGTINVSNTENEGICKIQCASIVLVIDSLYFNEPRYSFFYQERKMMSDKIEHAVEYTKQDKPTKTRLNDGSFFIGFIVYIW